MPVIAMVVFSKKWLTAACSIVVAAVAIILLSINTACCQNQIVTDTMTWAGYERTFKIYVSTSWLQGQSVPLLLALHGGGGDSQDMVDLTFSRFNTIADREGLIVAYPDGVEKMWEDGRPSLMHVVTTDDVGFIGALIDRMMANYNIDTKRVYATGMSNGARMCYRLANDLSGKITAIAPVSGAIPAERVWTLPGPTKPVSVLALNGTSDPLAPWNGGPPLFGGHEDGLSVRDSLSYFINYNLCSTVAVINYLPNIDPADGTTVWKELYANGTRGSEVVLCGVMEGGHTWPDGLQYLDESVIGKTTRDINACEVIWDFFETHLIAPDIVSPAVPEGLHVE